MIKLYKHGASRLLFHEAWVEDGAIVEHWGAIGDRGATRRHRLDPSRAEQASLEAVLAPAVAQGFAPIPMEEHHVLLVEYPVQGMGTGVDVAKRHALEDHLNNLLGWTGLGHCDGGSIGSGTMEACCYVVDFQVAKGVVEKDLAGTDFGDFSRVYEEA